MSLFSKNRLVSLASASALVATLAVASLPGATLAAAPTSGPTGFYRDGINLTAKQIGGKVTGDLDATGYDIAVYNPTSVKNADIHGAKYFGILVDGKKVDTTGSTVRNIGDSPLSGMQYGRAILYTNGASGAIRDNKVYAFQKNGIVVDGRAADLGASTHKTSATIEKNVVTGAGPTDLIAQNGIVILYGANATVKGNTVSNVFYTPAGTEAFGLLLIEAGKVTGSHNTYSANEENFLNQNSVKVDIKS